MSLTRRVKRGRGVRTASAAPGRDYEWLESHPHRQQSNSAAAEREGHRGRWSHKEHSLTGPHS